MRMVIFISIAQTCCRKSIACYPLLQEAQRLLPEEQRLGEGTAKESAGRWVQPLAGRPFLWQMPQTVAFDQAVEFLSKVGGVIAGALEGLGH